MIMNDNESNLLTKLDKNLKFVARNKLGKLLAQNESSINMNYIEFVLMLKDKSEWMNQIQEINWVET